MNDGLKANLRRLERLVRIRQTLASVAEASVKQAEGEVRNLESANSATVGNIKDTQAGIAYLRTAAGEDVQRSETYLRALERQRKLIKQSLEKANDNLTHRRGEWTEAMRDERIAERLQERRLHQWQRETDTAQQKSQDDASITRYVREQSEE
jgi:flagellar export protein FliJ